MKIQIDNLRIIFVAVGLIGVLLFASPTVANLVAPPVGEQFSGIYVLGPNHDLKDVPYYIKVGDTYSIYLGVLNEMGSSSYYTCFVKILNMADPLPNATIGALNYLPNLSEYNLFISNTEKWEKSITFKVNDLTITNGVSHLSSITINGINYTVNKDSELNSDKTGYYYSLLVELWIYNSTVGVSQYHNRYVNVILNLTQ